MDVFFCHTPGEPESPRNPKLSDITRNSLNLSWSEPLKDGGSHIIGYIIESRTPYNPRWSKVNRTPVKGTSYTLSDLLEGDELEFRVVAVNEAGYSKPSTSTPMTKVKDPFGGSTIVVVLWITLLRDISLSPISTLYILKLLLLFVVQCPIVHGAVRFVTTNCCNMKPRVNL